MTNRSKKGKCFICENKHWLDSCNKCGTLVCYKCLNPSYRDGVIPVKKCGKCGNFFPKNKYNYHDFNIDQIITYLRKRESDRKIKLGLQDPKLHPDYTDILALSPQYGEKTIKSTIRIVKKSKKHYATNKSEYPISGKDDAYIVCDCPCLCDLKITKSMLKRLIDDKYKPQKCIKKKKTKN